MPSSGTNSEVAGMLATIDAEITAAHLGVTGVASGAARHDFINARMQRMHEVGEQLCGHLGAQVAIPLIAEMMEKQHAAS